MINKTPSAISTKTPNLQLAWDATSLGELMFCPRKYQYTILQGWRAKDAVDLEFGGMAASSFEIYKKARLDGKTKDEATFDAVKFALNVSWNENGPWGGHYEEMWHCTGTEKYKNSRGNRAKCPYSHKGKWFPDPAPDECGECGSPIETMRRWIPRDKVKNRKTLIRLVYAYCCEQPNNMDEGLMPLKFPNGQPAVELSFKMPLPFKTKKGEPYILAGHLDSIMTDGQENFIADNKSTKKSLTKMFWKTFSPNIQVDTYDFTGSVLWPDLKIRGILIEGAQTMVDGAEISSHIVYKNEPQREEYLKDLEYWLGQAEKFAEDDYWPMNRRNCWLCPFKDICSKEPSKREMYLKADFEQRFWNPLIER